MRDERERLGSSLIPHPSSLVVPPSPLHGVAGGADRRRRARPIDLPDAHYLEDADWLSSLDDVPGRAIQHRPDVLRLPDDPAVLRDQETVLGILFDGHLE